MGPGYRCAAAAARDSARQIKEGMMATINAPASERRRILDRRSTGNTAGKSKMGALDWVAMALLAIGGLNWGAVGLLNIDVVAAVLGTQTPLARIVYVVVGLAALYSIYAASKMAARTLP
jgi:uncharacterized membrane protein YuzA (DUF378 family)